MIATGTLLVASTIGALLVLNVLAIGTAIRSELFERRQMVFQCLLILLLPFVGAVLVYLVTRDPYRKIGRGYQSGFGADGDGSIGGGPMDGSGHFGGGDH